MMKGQCDVRRARGSRCLELLTSQYYSGLLLPACLLTAGGTPPPFTRKASACSEPPKSLLQSFVQFKTDTVIIQCNTSQKYFLLNAWTIWAAPGKLQASLIMHPCLSIDLDNWYLEASSQGVVFSHQLASFCQCLDVDITSNWVLKARGAKIVFELLPGFGILFDWCNS